MTWKDNFNKAALILNSRPFYVSLGLDALLFVAIFLVGSGYNLYLINKAAFLGGINSPEQLTQLISNAPVEQAQAIAADLKSLFMTVMVGLITLITFIIGFYSWNRAYLWNYLLGKKLSRKRFWKWNIFHFIIFLPLALVFLVATIILAFLESATGTLPYPVVIATLVIIYKLLILVSMLFFTFLFYHNFANSYKAWLSIGDAFGIVSKHRKRLYRAFPIMILGVLIISTISALIGKLFFQEASWIPMFIYFALFIIYLSWMRVYVVEVLKD